MKKIKKQELFQTAAYLDGQWIGASSTGETYEVINPTTRQSLASLPLCGEEETQNAITVAHRSFAEWKKTTARHRSNLMMKWYELMLEYLEDLAIILTSEQGKPLAEAKGEIQYAANFVRWYAEEAVRTNGDTIPTHKEDARIIVNKVPVGVVGIITPWNFPSAMITRKLAPALAAGCTAVIKPSELTPFSALALAQIAEEAGIPKGVINIVFGKTEAIGKTLTTSETVRKISFTGSTRVGRILMEQSSSTIKRISLELGGNAPFIVFDDANLERAVNELIKSKFRNSGQTCVCANRIFVQRSIADDFIPLLQKAVEKLKVGDGMEEGTTQGPLISEAALQKVHQHIDDALAKGAQIVCGGKNSSMSDELGGYFFEPTILTDVKKEAQLNQEETFGPVAPIIYFDHDDEVIEMANATEFGLASYFFTDNLTRAWRVAEALETGMVGVNEGIISTEVAPFGGVKQSGLGREGSKCGIDEYLESQYILMGLT